MEKHILIMEDDPFLKELYKFIFRKASIKATILEDGDEFIRVLKEEEVHLVIMDINLKNTYVEGKKIDGIFLSRYIKQDDKLSSVPIIVVTAYTMNGSNRKLFEESLADDYVTKPIEDVNKFLNKIQNIMA